ncbi:MAG: zinc-ribbon domain-containing protein [Acutalibacteraceae bacterium]
MFCPKCGIQIPDESKFCSLCGFELTSEKVNIAPEQLGFSEEPEQLQSQAKASQTSVKSKIEQKKMFSKILIILVVLTIAFVAGLVIRNISETKEMRTAIKNNDAAAIYNIYQMAIGNEKLIGKYNNLIFEKIAEISADINAYDCSEAAKTQGAEAFDGYIRSKYGALLYGDYYSLEDSIYTTTNESEYYVLEDLIESKRNYYKGIYYSSNVEDVYDYEEAIEAFSAVWKDDSNYEDAMNKITECSELYMELALKTVEEHIADGDISGAIDLLSSTKDFFDSVGLDSTEIQSEIDSVLATYAKKYADKAEAAFKEQDVNAAIGNIKVAIELQPENADYQVKISEYELYLPFELYKESNVLEYEENGDFWGTLYMDNTYKANDGSEMSHSIEWYNNNSDASVSMSAIYNLKGKYDVVTGKIFLLESDKSTDFKGYFVVYGDGKKIYTSPKVTGGVVPQEIKFEVSDVQTLEIAFFGQGTGGFLGSGPSFGVSNLVAQKSFSESKEN